MKLFTNVLFIDAMTAIKKQIDIDDECTEAFQKILPTDFVSGYNNGAIISKLIEIIELDLDDKDKMIQYFIFELEWGHKYKDGMVTDEKGDNIKLELLTDLWEYLTSK